MAVSAQLRGGIAGVFQIAGGQHSGSGPRCFLSRLALIQHRHSGTPLRQEIGRRQPDDSATYNDHIGNRISGWHVDDFLTGVNLNFRLHSPGLGRRSETSGGDNSARRRVLEGLLFKNGLEQQHTKLTNQVGGPSHSAGAFAAI